MAKRISRSDGLIHISKFGGAVTDQPEDHILDNYFLKLCNFEVVPSGFLRKIPGYTKYSEYQFASPVVNLTQLIRADDQSYLFAFADEGIFFEEAPSFTLFNTDYTGFVNPMTKVYHDRVFVVEGDKYPFFISRDESSFDLNIWARLVNTGGDNFQILDANDPTKPAYKTFSIGAQFVDGSPITIDHNSVSAGVIICSSNFWLYKFDYGAEVYDFVLKKELANQILSIDYYDDSLGVLFVDGSTPQFIEYDYDFNPITVPVNYFWGYSNFTNTNINGKHTTADPDITVRLDVAAGVFSAVPYAVAIYDLNMTFEMMATLDFDTATDFYSAKINKLVQDSEPLSLSQRLENNEVSATATLVVDLQCTMIHMRERLIGFVKDDKFYVAMKKEIKLEYERDVSGTVTYSDGGPQTATKLAEIAKIYEINSVDFAEAAVQKTFAEIQAMYLAGDYDFVLNDHIVNFGSQPLLNYVDGVSVTTPIIEGARVNDYRSHTSPYHIPNDNAPISWADPLHPWEFYFRADQVDSDLFKPYISEYIVDEFAVRKIGAPGKPYPLINDAVAGTINGTYKFFCKYITPLNATSESVEGAFSEEEVLTNQSVDLYWAYISANHFSLYDIQKLRIYAQDQATGISICIYEVLRYIDNDPLKGETPEWLAGYVTLTEIADVGSYYDTYAVVPKCKIVGVHQNRLVFLNSDIDSSAYYYSEPGDPESFPIANFASVQKGDKDQLTGFASFYDRGIFFKEQSIHARVGDLGAANLIPLVIADKYGNYAPGAVVVYKNTVIFFDREAGVCLLSGNKVIEISKNIFNEYIFSTFTESAIRGAKGVFDSKKKHYRLYIDGICVVTDMNGNFWFEDKTGRSYYTAVAEMVTDANVRDSIFIDLRGYIYKDRYTNFFDDNKRFAYFFTKKYKLSELENTNFLNRFLINGEINSVVAIFDLNDEWSFKIEPSTSRYYEKDTNNKIGDSIQLGLYEESHYDLELYDIQIAYD